MAVEGAVDAGLALLEMKPHVGHGNWLAWVDANCTCGARQAQKYHAPGAGVAFGQMRPEFAFDRLRALAALVAPEPEPEDNEPKHDIRLRQLAADINQSHTKVLEHFDAIEAMRIELSRKNPGDPRYGSFRALMTSLVEKDLRLPPELTADFLKLVDVLRGPDSAVFGRVDLELSRIVRDPELQMRTRLDDGMRRGVRRRHAGRGRLPPRDRLPRRGRVPAHAGVLPLHRRRAGRSSDDRGRGPPRDAV